MTRDEAIELAKSVLIRQIDTYVAREKTVPEAEALVSHSGREVIGAIYDLIAVVIEPSAQIDWQAVMAELQRQNTEMREYLHGATIRGTTVKVEKSASKGKYRDQLLFAAHRMCEGGSDVDFLEIVDRILDEIAERT